MIFELYDCRGGMIKSVSIDLSKLDKDVSDHLLESIKTKVKIVDRKLIIKTYLTFDELKTLNEGYLEFHSQFILDNIVDLKKRKVDSNINCETDDNESTKSL